MAEIGPDEVTIHRVEEQHGRLDASVTQYRFDGDASEQHAFTLRRSSECGNIDGSHIARWSTLAGYDRQGLHHWALPRHHEKPGRGGQNQISSLSLCTSREAP